MRDTEFKPTESKENWVWSVLDRLDEARYDGFSDEEYKFLKSHFLKYFKEGEGMDKNSIPPLFDWVEFNNTQLLYLRETYQIRELWNKEKPRMQMSDEKINNLQKRLEEEAKRGSKLEEDNKRLKEEMIEILWKEQEEKK